MDKGHLEVITAVIMGFDVPDSAAVNTSNVKLLVDLLMSHLIHQILDSGIKIARVLIMVGLKGQLGLGQQGVHDTFQEMADVDTGIVGNIFHLLYQGQHRLIVCLDAFNIIEKGKSPMQPARTEVLNCLLQLGGKQVLCTRSKESIIEFPPGRVEF